MSPPVNWKPPTATERKSIVNILRHLLVALEEQTKRLERMQQTIEETVKRFEEKR